MPDQNTELSKPGNRFFPGPVPGDSRRQQRLMLVALVLLLISLGFVLYRDRDFWFPEAQVAAFQPAATIPEAGTPASASHGKAAVGKQKSMRHASSPAKTAHIEEVSDPPTTITRTVLPPLEVEVVAGDTHRTVRPGSSAVSVDVQRKAPRQPAGGGQTENASVATPAAERANISSEPETTIVTQSVQPEYPMLARQMKVQGSVILQALIGRDGLIQDLRVLSGPPILAAAAREAVRQWHFKPHFEGNQPVETRANVTVNFTISTN